MVIQYRKLTEKELDTFIEMRICQLREEGATEDLDLKSALRDYYNRHMADGTFISWLAVDGDKIVGTSGMSFIEKPPYNPITLDASFQARPIFPDLPQNRY